MMMMMVVMLIIMVVVMMMVMMLVMMTAGCTFQWWDFSNQDLIRAIKKAINIFTKYDEAIYMLLEPCISVWLL